MQYPYHEIEPGKFGPIVSLYLTGPIRTIEFEAFIDSGADFSIFDSDTAKLLGIHYTKGKKMIFTVGDGDRMAGYLQHVKVFFNGISFTMPICFSTQLGSGFNLLGRSGFFSKFCICFHEKNRYVSIVKEAV